MLKMGQQGQLNRYPVHWNGCQLTSGNFIKNCALRSLNNRGIVIAGTHGVLVEGNTLFDVMGNGIMLPDGSETNNVITNNLVMGVREGSVTYVDVRPSGVFVSNPDNTVTGNTVAGSFYHGFQYFLRSRAIGLSATYSVCAKGTPLKLFDNNKAHST